MTRVLASGARLLVIYAAQQRAQWTMVAIHGMVLPAVAFYLGTRLSGERTAMRDAWAAGALTLSVGMCSTWLVGTAVLIDRFEGRRALLRTLPIPPLAYYGTHLTTNALVSVVIVTSGVAVFTLAGVAQVAWTGYVAALLAASLAGGAVGGLGAAIAARSSTLDDGLNALVLGTLGLVALSPVFYPASSLPAWVGPLTWLSPFTHLAECLRAVMTGQLPPAGALVGLAGLSVALHAVGYRALR